MKNFKIVLYAVAALLFSFCGGAMLGAIVNYPLVGGISAMVLAITPGTMPHGVAIAGVYKEIWTGEILKKFRSDKSWISTIQSKNDLVNNNAIHMVDVGVDPNVLINNTTYPIPVASRTDADVSISLDKFETENTSVTADELYAISYDKINSVIEDHKEALSEKEVRKAAHSLAPQTNTANTPIILTSGVSDGGTYQRKRLSPNDLIDAKKALDDLEVPNSNRILVLCSDHVRDLLKVDETFSKQYKDMASGTVLDLYGFKMYEWHNNPKYKDVNGTLTKKAFAAAAEPALDQNCSFFYYSPRAFQATGTTEMFYSEASKDPQFRRNLVGFRQWHICLPKKTTGFGAIVSAIYPTT